MNRPELFRITYTGAVQVEERLRFYDDGVAPRKNATVMAEAMEKSKAEMVPDDAATAQEDTKPAAKKAKKKRASAVLFCSLCWFQGGVIFFSCFTSSCVAGCCVRATGFGCDTEEEEKEEKQSIC